MIREFVINYIFVWINSRGSGHLKLINKNMTRLFENELPVIDDSKKDNFIIHDFTYYYIIEYLSKIIEKYTRGNEFHMNDYFREVFLKNIDVWGFVMIYMPFIEELDDKRNKLTKNETKLFESLKYIIVHFLFETPVEPINITQLVDKLRELDDLFSNQGNGSNSKGSNSKESKESKDKKYTQKQSLKKSSNKTRSLKSLSK
jgi:hypothetical protein